MYNNKNKTKGVFIMTKRIGPNNVTEITEYGMRIVMDEEKILKEDKYELDEIYRIIDEIAEYTEMKKIDKYYYISKNDSPVDLGCFIFTNLEEKEWFMNNVKEIIWFDKDDGIHDILTFIKNKNLEK